MNNADYALEQRPPLPTWRALAMLALAGFVGAILAVGLLLILYLGEAGPQEHLDALLISGQWDSTRYSAMTHFLLLLIGHLWLAWSLNRLLSRALMGQPGPRFMLTGGFPALLRASYVTAGAVATLCVVVLDAG